MLTGFRIWLVVLSFLLSTVAPIAAADDASDALKPDAPLNERVLSVPGDPERPVTLQVTVYMPSGPGPFPLAVMNHGSTSKEPPAQQPRYHITFAAYYFLSRGYAVALPMMRGYAGSEGKLSYHGCDDAATGISAAKDIRAVIDYMKQQPGIDGSRIVVAGQSFGGWNTLGLGALNVPDVKGLVSFAGGMKETDCDTPDSSLIDAAGQLGAHTTIPSIWFFGDNDRVFPVSTWRGMYEHYTAAGGHAELVAYGSFGTDAHEMLGSGAALPIWVPKVDAFLAKVGLPNSPVYPEYMPSTKAPPPSHYASLTDVKALPYMGEQGAGYYQQFLMKPLPRAFAIGRSSAASFSGGFDPINRALKACQQQTQDCQLYAVDNDVVWVRPTQEPPPTRFAALEDQRAVPYLNDQGREGYEKFLAMRRPRAFVIAPDGGWNGAFGRDPLADAMDACNKTHKGCKLYAVDGDVVWPGQAHPQ